MKRLRKKLFVVLIASLLSGQMQALPVEALREEIAKAKSDTARARMMGQLAWEIRFSQPDEALKLADAQLRIATQYNLPVYLTEAYRVKALLNVVQGNSAAALDLFNLALASARKAKHLRYEAACLSMIAGMYQDKGDYDQSLRYYLMGLQVAEKSKINHMIAVLSNNTASVYSDMGRPPEKILPFYQRALACVIPDSDWSFAGLICSNIATEYHRAGQMNLCETYIARAFAFSEKPGVLPYDYATTRTEAGAIYLKSGRPELAEAPLLVSLHILDSLQMPDNLLRPLSALAKLYVLQNRLEKADSFGHRLLHVAQKQNAKLFIRDGYKVLSDVARKRGQYEEALQLYEQYAQWNDSVFNEVKEKSIANAEAQGLLKRHELETKLNVQHQRDENEILKKVNLRLYNEKIIAFAGCIFLLISGFFLYNAFVIKNRKNKELEKQKLIIQNQSVEKDTLIREIHHRVKNNLQIVSSLLNLQANSLQDPAALEALRESQNRVKTISLIHQKLYTFDALSAIPLENYIQQLWAHLRTIYSTSNIELKTLITPPNLQLDMESSIPVGLILNELITNSIKYAFTPDQSQAIITITFEDNGKQFYTLNVSDNGAGMPENFDPVKSPNLGMRILFELARQLKGKTWFSAQSGSSFTMVFPHTSERKKDS